MFMDYDEQVYKDEEIRRIQEEAYQAGWKDATFNKLSKGDSPMPYTILPVDNRPLQWPVRAHDTDAGLDLFWCPPAQLDVPPTTSPGVAVKWKDPLPDMILEPNCTVMLDTGIWLDLPSDKMGFVLSRSGLAKKGVIVANAPGLIDPDYKGGVKVLLLNCSPVRHLVKQFDRIAQLVVLPKGDMHALYARALGTSRGTGGIGSTGA